MTSETNIENSLGYLPKNNRDWLWFSEGICAGAIIMIIIFTAAICIGGVRL